MNILSTLSEDQKREIRSALFASEEFYTALAIGLGRIGLVTYPGDLKTVDRIIHPKITLELAHVRELINFARQALPILAEGQWLATAGRPTTGANASAVHNALRAAIEKVEKVLDFSSAKK